MSAPLRRSEVCVMPLAEKRGRPDRRLLALGAAVVLLDLLPILSAQAALPPYFQRQRELGQILSSGEVEQNLGEQPIDAIERVGDDLYQVRAGECRLEVTIVDAPTEHEEGWVGPREFGIEVGQAICD